MTKQLRDYLEEKGLLESVKNAMIYTGKEDPIEIDDLFGSRDLYECFTFRNTEEHHDYWQSIAEKAEDEAGLGWSCGNKC